MDLIRGTFTGYGNDDISAKANLKKERLYNVCWLVAYKH